MIVIDKCLRVVDYVFAGGQARTTHFFNGYFCDFCAQNLTNENCQVTFPYKSIINTNEDLLGIISFIEMKQF